MNFSVDLNIGDRVLTDDPFDDRAADADLHHAAVIREEVAIGEVAAQHQQKVALLERVIAGREADQAGHADIVWIIPFDMLLSAQGMDDRGLQPFGNRQQFVMCPGATGAAVKRG